MLFWEQFPKAQMCIMSEKDIKMTTKMWCDQEKASLCFIINHFIAILYASCGCKVKKIGLLETVKPYRESA